MNDTSIFPGNDIAGAPDDGAQIGKAPVTYARAKAIVEMLAGLTEREAKLLAGIDSYATWFIGIASAGIAISITQSKQISDASLLVGLLPQWAGHALISIAAILFAMAAAIGSVVKIDLHVETHAKYKLITQWWFQLARIEGGECNPLPAMTAIELYNSICAGQFLAPEQKAGMEELSAKETKRRDSRIKSWNAQQRATATGVVLLALVAAF